MSVSIKLDQSCIAFNFYYFFSPILNCLSLNRLYRKRRKRSYTFKSSQDNLMVWCCLQSCVIWPTGPANIGLRRESIGVRRMKALQKCHNHVCCKKAPSIKHLTHDRFQLKRLNAIWWDAIQTRWFAPNAWRLRVVLTTKDYITQLGSTLLWQTMTKCFVQSTRHLRPGTKDLCITSAGGSRKITVFGSMLGRVYCCAKCSASMFNFLYRGINALFPKQNNNKTKNKTIHPHAHRAEFFSA